MAGSINNLTHQRKTRGQARIIDTTLMVGRATLGMYLGGEHDRYNVDFAIVPHSDRYDDGGC